MRAKEKVRTRLLLVCAAAGLVLALVPLASGRSRSAAVGPYSPARLVMMLALALAAAASLLGAVMPGLSPLRSAARLLRRAARRAPLPELALPLSVLLVFFLWLLHPLPVFDDPRFTLGLMLTGVCLPSAWMSVMEKPRRRLAAGRAAAAFGGILVAVLAGELLARVIMPGLVFDPRFRLRPHMSYRIEVDLPGVSHGGTVTTNRWGLRGEEPPGDWEEWTTIMAVGGSTTVNFYLGDSLTWPAVVQRELRESRPRVWVGNGGVPAQSAETHDIFLREVVEPIGPGYAVFLVGVNDMDIFLRGGPRGRGDRLPELGPRVWLYRHSRLYQALYTAKKVALDNAVVVRETADPPFEPRPLPEEAPLPEDLHALMPRPDIYRDRIRRLVETSREIGVRPVFLTQPVLYDDSPRWRSVAAATAWTGQGELPISGATFWRMLQTLNGDLMEVCREMDVPCFDLAGHFPHDRRYFYDAMHFTEDGAELVGTLVARFLEEEVLPGP